MNKNLFFLISISCNLSLIFAKELNYLDLKESSFTPYEEGLLLLVKELSEINDKINKIRIIGKISPFNKKLEKDLKEATNKKDELLLKIKIRNYIYEQVKKTRESLIEKNLSTKIEIKKNIIENLNQKLNTILNELQDLIKITCSDDILELFFSDKTIDLKQLKQSAINLNRYFIKNQKWIDILISIRINQQINEKIVTALTDLVKDIRNFYTFILKNTGNQLKSKSNNILNPLKKVFYKDIIQEINDAKAKSNTAKVSELTELFKKFNSTLKINKTEKDEILKSIPTTDPEEEEFDLEVRMHDLKILSATLNVLSNRST